MTSEQLTQLLKKIIIEEGGGDDINIQINDETDLIKDLGFDSLMYLKVLICIEEETGVELDDEDINDISKVSSLLSKING